MSSEAYLTESKEPPPLNIPGSNVTVKVSCIDSTSSFKIPLGPFLQPDYVNRQHMIGPSFSFLIEHPSQKRILFDLGVRKDWEKYPSYPKWIKLGWEISVKKDVRTILTEHSVDVAGGAIDAIVWSHHHWDHVGDPSTFPASTQLVVGPGFKEAHMPGYPKNKSSTLLETDFEGREVREVDFTRENNGLKIGRFNALDYFGDGSFYLLDTPGHSIGHICGFARTSINPDTFIFMGGDASHHGGEFRPTVYLPIPKEVSPSPLVNHQSACPGHLFADINPHQSPSKPFYYVTDDFAHDKAIADWTIDGLGEFDAHANVLLLLAHDNAVVNPPQIDFFPTPLNEWYQAGYGQKVKWKFLEDFGDAIEAKADGDQPFSWGKYP